MKSLFGQLFLSRKDEYGGRGIENDYEVKNVMEWLSVVLFYGRFQSVGVT